MNIQSWGIGLNGQYQRTSMSCTQGKVLVLMPEREHLSPDNPDMHTLSYPVGSKPFYWLLSAAILLFGPYGNKAHLFILFYAARKYEIK